MKIFPFLYRLLSWVCDSDTNKVKELCLKENNNKVCREIISRRGLKHKLFYLLCDSFSILNAFVIFLSRTSKTNKWSKLELFLHKDEKSDAGRYR